MKRTAIFAHFDRENVIRDYVLFYIEELKKVAENVIFVSCSDLPEKERKKLDIPVICEPHQEYDFGSYKRGFNYAEENGLLKDEIILANDSCYGPIRPFTEIFEMMNASDCDFWGMTGNKYGFKNKRGKYKDCIRPHIQSYFMVFRKSTFKDLSEILNSVHVEKNKNDIIEKYEIGLSETLEKSGFKPDSYVKALYKYKNPTIFRWRELTKYSPLIKCSLFRLDNRLHTTIQGWEDYIGDYPAELISAPQIRTSVPLKFKLAMFEFLDLFPYKVRLKIAYIIKRFFGFMLD